MAEFVLMALPPVRVWWVAFFVCMLVLMMMVDLYAMVLGGKFFFQFSLLALIIF